MTNEVLLRTVKLRRTFGGLAANDRVSIELKRGEVHALLGPNGAGKSTLINLLSGDIPATSGEVFYCGRDITKLTPHERSLIGIGRSYQKTNIFPGFTVRENVRLAAQSREPRAARIFSDAAAFGPYCEVVDEALHLVRLAGVADRKASELSHGQQRQLELGIVLATKPRVLLLDEPLAGMGHEESLKMIELLRGLVASHAILLVEHDMDAVFAIADVLTVMVNGVVLITGTPQEIRASREVREAYLGAEEQQDA
ncbi:ABC transporter ATP-binding protein [Ramlibacter albus]|uniref:ABC transporter ATP-binding protein n=1 Tax=Ramlibacter albus TaxID=2079448 RepID=A0A923S3F1_9BURK|nr:ABC transporter ATP-binding protein [Ramlibacter albus]MBC5763057.1 ABC transporter ATP-binding protein [Ramlibacter albus]